MGKLLNIFRRFARNEDGAFLTIFGIMAIVIVALSGAVVDYVTVEQARVKAQAALDSAALSLQPDIYTDDDATLKNKAEALVEQQIGDSRIKVKMEDIDTDTTDGSIYLKAQLTVPMTFVQLVGIKQMQPMIVSEATRKKLYLEVSMVLDNSGSMGSESRLTNLKAAAKSATNILMEYSDPATGGDGSTNETTFISIVPFNFWVNIGADKKDKWWMDQAGAAPAGTDNINTLGTYSLNSRFDLYNAMGIAWKGCVEARKYPYDTDDTVPDPMVPDTLYEPEFAPDQPDDGRAKGGWGTYSYNNDYLYDDPHSCAIGTRNCKIVRTRTGCNNGGNWCSSDNTTYKATYGNGTVDTSYNACSCDKEPDMSSNTTKTSTSSGYTFTTTTTCTDYYSNVASMTERQRQERICKYVSPTFSGHDQGPNEDCISTSILPLTNNRDSVMSKINAMVANGATNIHLGAAWGFRTLSPTEPFNEGRDYDTATYKVLILMTDGQNTYYKYGDDTSTLNGSSLYTPYGFPYNGRMGSMSDTAADMEDHVDTLLGETCTNIKNQGITIYTIGLASPDSVKNMLINCATDPDHAFFPAASSDLGSTFEEIALQLADLRLAL